MIDPVASERTVVIWKPPPSAYPFVEGSGEETPYAINFRGGSWDADFLGVCSSYAEALDGARMIADALGILPLDMTGEAQNLPRPG